MYINKKKRKNNIRRQKLSVQNLISISTDIYCTARDHLLQILRTTSTLPLHYLLVFILSIKGTLLLALLARDRWSITFLRICTPLAFATDKCSNGIAVFASRRLSVGFYILFTLFTYGACVTLSVKAIEIIQFYCVILFYR